MTESYSQFGQDLHLLNKVYQNKKTGYFVEVGAYNGIDMSNTYLLEKLGWSGLCVEPNPRYFEKMKQVRTCSTSSVAVYDRDDETVDFMDDPSGGCSSIAETDLSHNKFTL